MEQQTPAIIYRLPEGGEYSDVDAFRAMGMALNCLHTELVAAGALEAGAVPRAIRAVQDQGPGVDLVLSMLAGALERGWPKAGVRTID